MDDTTAKSKPAGQVASGTAVVREETQRVCNTEMPIESTHQFWNKEHKSDYAAIGKEIGELVAKKNLAYGDSFTRTGAVLRAYFPDGIEPDQYDLMSYIVRTSDKFFRLIANNDPAGENPAMDIAGYSILEVGRRKEK